jgi:tetrahydromethanopterin S-methyltransferase subunit C
MAATKSQGSQFTLFMVGLTAVCAGIAFFDSGVAKVALIAGAVVLAISLWGLFKIKPLEGKTGGTPQPAVMKLIGVVVVAGGWLFVLFGLHMTSSVGGRMVTSIIGFVVSLIGICYVLAPAVNKNAIWKS